MSCIISKILISDAYPISIGLIIDAFSLNNNNNKIYLVVVLSQHSTTTLNLQFGYGENYDINCD
ncbi:hypothetical protein DERF_004773 [Dermatophagoides farinae]|uniref:Uncharacterized protein n=1 Tax=Dermatophagoides farinae TaxID=6954 RepID=A0A922L822_DERFA|nr:hypothetical protein DERF_004773 [Dermatophagoides farinae]